MPGPALAMDNKPSLVCLILKFSSANLAVQVDNLLVKKDDFLAIRSEHPTSVDGLSASAVAASEVTALAHKAWDDAVKLTGLESEAFLSCAQSTEVFGSLWNNVSVQLEGDAAFLLAVDLDVEKDLRVLHG